MEEYIEETATQFFDFQLEVLKWIGVVVVSLAIVVAIVMMVIRKKNRDANFQIDSVDFETEQEPVALMNDGHEKEV